MSLECSLRYASFEMNGNRADWYRSTAMLFFAAGICISTMAFFSMFDDWFGGDKDISMVIALIGAGCALNSGLYYGMQRGKYGAFLSMKLNQIHFWLTLATLVLLLYYGQLSHTVARAHYANYPQFRGRMNSTMILAELTLALSGVAFVSNMIRATAREKRARAVT